MAGHPQAPRGDPRQPRLSANPPVAYAGQKGGDGGPNADGGRALQNAGAAVAPPTARAVHARRPWVVAALACVVALACSPGCHSIAGSTAARHGSRVAALPPLKTGRIYSAYDVFTSPYQNVGRRILMAPGALPIVVNGLLIRYLDYSRSPTVAASWMAGLRFEKDLDEESDLFSLRELNTGPLSQFGNPTVGIGQMEVEFGPGAGRGALDTRRIWVVEPLGLDHSLVNGYGAPMALPAVRFYGYWNMPPQPPPEPETAVHAAPAKPIRRGQRRARGASAISSANPQPAPDRPLNEGREAQQVLAPAPASTAAASIADAVGADVSACADALRPSGDMGLADTFEGAERCARAAQDYNEGHGVAQNQALGSRLSTDAEILRQYYSCAATSMSTSAAPCLSMGRLAASNGMFPQALVAFRYACDMDLDGDGCDELAHQFEAGHGTPRFATTVERLYLKGCSRSPGSKPSAQACADYRRVCAERGDCTPVFPF